MRSSHATSEVKNRFGASFAPKVLRVVVQIADPPVTSHFPNMGRPASWSRAFEFGMVNRSGCRDRASESERNGPAP